MSLKKKLPHKNRFINFYFVHLKNVYKYIKSTESITFGEHLNMFEEKHYIYIT